jgi:cation diffusion facilitator CzcD-associated flavoprotein CzcO
MTYDRAMANSESVDVVVVGAGPAGLANAACLAERGVDYALLERDRQVGSAWRRHYDRLHLHTNKGSSELPGLSFPRGTGRYPSRQQVVDYLEAYADRFAIEPRFGVEVTSIRRPLDNGKRDRWAVSAGDLEIECRCAVVTTGYTRVPHRPTWPGLDGFPGPVIHSSEYRNGEPYRDQRVLVVGFGNSGGEIAICLHEHGANPGLAVRGRVNVVPRDISQTGASPVLRNERAIRCWRSHRRRAERGATGRRPGRNCDILGMPILAVGISLAWLPAAVADALSWPLLAPTFRRARRAGLRLNRYGVFSQIKNDLRIPLLDIGTVDLMRRGAITAHRGVERIDGDEVVFDGGERERFDAIVLATGYRASLEDLVDAGGALGDDGLPTVSGGPIPGAPGLFFSGFYLAPTGMFREIALEAPRVASAVAATLR